MSPHRPSPLRGALRTAMPKRRRDRRELEGVDESTWLDVIRKMDEVYSQLIDDEIELEEKNARLEQTQQFVYSVLSAMSDVLVVCGADGAIEQTNAALCELVGQRDEALRGQPVFSLLADEASTTSLHRLIGEADPARRGRVLELNLRDARGTAVPVDASCTPRLLADGRRVGTVVVGRPMAEIRRAYRELHQAHEALQRAQQHLVHAEKMASLGRLVAGVAHELNNPISFVLGNVHALQRYSERLQRYLDAIHGEIAAAEREQMRRKLRIDHLVADLPSLIDGTLEGARRTADIVNGLKRFSTMDPREREAVDLNDVVERAIHWIRRGTHPRFDVHWDRVPIPAVQGSMGQLQQVVMNLLQNAIDASQPEASGNTGGNTGRNTGGTAAAAAAPRETLTATAATAPDSASIWITLHAADDRVRMHVRDAGPGIAPEHLNRVFDPFFTTKAVGRGTGLGLSISYGIVEQHRGRLSVRNHPAGGAEFIVDLPVR